MQDLNYIRRMLVSVEEEVSELEVLNEPQDLKFPLLRLRVTLEELLKYVSKLEVENIEKL